jgi:hypothetical protein
VGGRKEEGKKSKAKKRLASRLSGWDADESA